MQANDERKERPVLKIKTELQVGAILTDATYEEYKKQIGGHASACGKTINDFHPKTIFAPDTNRFSIIRGDCAEKTKCNIGLTATYFQDDKKMSKKIQERFFKETTPKCTIL